MSATKGSLRNLKMDSTRTIRSYVRKWGGRNNTTPYLSQQGYVRVPDGVECPEEGFYCIAEAEDMQPTLLCAIDINELDSAENKRDEC